MKKTAKILPLAILSLALLAGCTVDKYIGSDNTDNRLYSNVDSRYLNSFFTVVQLAHFFTAYQGYLAESEDAANFYLELFIGTYYYTSGKYEIDEEHFKSNSRYGEITRGDSDNEYIVRPLPYTYDQETQAYEVTFTSDTTFTVIRERAVDESFTSAEFEVSADVTVSGGTSPTLRITDFLLDYVETVDGDTLYMKVTGDDKGLLCSECRNASGIEPDSGTLYFTFSGRYESSFTRSY